MGSRVQGGRENKDTPVGSKPSTEAGRFIRLSIASEADREIFAAWRRVDRLEEQTCRPIRDNRRMGPSDDNMLFACFLDEVAEPVGKIVFFDWNPRNRSLEFGYTVDPRFRGRGIGRRMLIMAIGMMFRSRDLNKLYCQTGSFNLSSIKLLERLGFLRDGVLRQHHELDGILYDDYVYSVLRSEWTRWATEGDLP